METARLRDDLRRVAAAAGLDAVGFAGAEPFDAARAVIEERKARGLGGGMQFTYRNPARSTDPCAALPGARSLVVAARHYLRVAPPAPDGDAPAGRVARYSWVDHYAPLRRGLEAVAARLRADGWRTKVLADDNAMVDRAAAHRAGLGWYGKNTNLLLPGAGSWFVLGSVVTDAPLPRDVPVTDGCGSCQRCLPACPTGALTSPGVLDARRCLAWLVQAKGVFPVEHRVALGDRMYGCDECQEACPANRRATRAAPPGPAEPGAEAWVDVLAVLAASDTELLDRHGRWYIPGRDPRYLRRNALVVLANVGDGRDPSVVDTVRRHLAAADGLLRAHAVWAAARLGRRDLLAGMAAETDPLVRTELAGVDSVPVRVPDPAAAAVPGPSPGAPVPGRPFPRP